MKCLLIAVITLFLPARHRIGYDKAFVEIKTVKVSGASYGIVKLRRINNRIKAKYFASHDFNGSSIGERYTQWSADRNIVTYTSGTYANNCNGTTTNPVGLCIDQGKMVNSNLVTDYLDGLVIVYDTGGMFTHNLKKGDLIINESDGRKKTLNLRSSAYDKAAFLKWAQEREATVFQAHLLAYKDSLMVAPNASARAHPRRFLAVCKLNNGEIIHYIINLPADISIGKGARNTLHYLKDSEEVAEVVFMINFDTGCQDLFTLYNPDGKENNDAYFKGNSKLPLSQAVNLLVYYYE